MSDCGHLAALGSSFELISILYWPLTPLVENSRAHNQSFPTTKTLTYTSTLITATFVSCLVSYQGFACVSSLANQIAMHGIEVLLDKYGNIKKTVFNIRGRTVRPVYISTRPHGVTCHKTVTLNPTAILRVATIQPDLFLRCVYRTFLMTIISGRILNDQPIIHVIIIEGRVSVVTKQTPEIKNDRWWPEIISHNARIPTSMPSIRLKQHGVLHRHKEACWY